MADGLRQTRAGRQVRPGRREHEEDVIDALWPREAPATVKAAVAGLFVMVAVAVLNIVTILLVAPTGAVVVEDVVIAVAFVAVVVGISRRASWSRFVGIGLAALFAIGAASQLRGGIPKIVIVVGVVQLVVLVAVIVLLLVRPTSDWYRYGA